MNDTPPLQLRLAPVSDAFSADDQRWTTQVSQLLAELKRSGGDIQREAVAVPGTKGGVDSLILALGSSGAIAAAVTVIRLWLARSADRSLEIEGEVGGKLVKLKVNGRNISEETLRRALGVAGK